MQTEESLKDCKLSIKNSSKKIFECDGRKWACSLVVERRICNAEVVGSNPTGSTTKEPKRS